ncbi:cupin domain-containing protein [Steroidobacter sp.]|uniref:cupin domain-containing protein n=1 Tax=Steroidobacter sp. TaxID=1978227 RepID=UPI001A405C46|nr:cupin domain-containing protein [Steroidobacter sp.]MBL8265795.1 cupin domain-containing protein [Steroidobacter sp.]
MSMDSRLWLCACLFLVASAFAASKPETLGSVALEWRDIPIQQEEVRAVRQFLRAPTATLNELELHVTTLPAGATSHAPHRHPNEELVIIKEGTVEVLVDGQLKRVGPGSVVFNASNQLHSLRNVGDGPATYHVINWTTAATPAK